MSDLYEPHERLVGLTVLGRDRRVPENNTLLRCLQYLSPEEVGMGSFCWNAQCRKCQVTLRRGGAASAALCCQTVVRDGDSIEEVSPEVMRAIREI